MTEILQRHVVTINMLENHHPAMFVVEDVFTLKKLTISVAMVTINKYYQVRFVARTTVVPYMSMMEMLVVMEDHTIITPSTVSVVHCIMITVENVVVVEWCQFFRHVVEDLRRAVCTMRPWTLGTNAVEII